MIENTELGQNATYRSIYYWFTVLSFVFIPLIILTIFNLFLIKSVRKSSQKRRQWIAEQQCSFHNETPTPTTTKTSGLAVISSGSCIVPRSPTQEQYFELQPKSRSLIRFGMSTRLKSAINQPKTSSKNQHPIRTKQIFQTSNTPTYRILLRQDAHITRLLIAVVLFFLICQLPSALVIIYSASIGHHQSSNQQVILHTLGNIFNLLVAINSAGNFVIYSLLSRKFRRTLLELIRKLKTKHKN